MIEEILAVGAEAGLRFADRHPPRQGPAAWSTTWSPQPQPGRRRQQAWLSLRNTNYGRDYTADIVTDLVAASDGYACPNCGAPLHTVRGVEVGNIFKLGTKYSVAMGATYLDENGESKPIVMGSYGIGTGRLMAVLDRDTTTTTTASSGRSPSRPIR